MTSQAASSPVSRRLHLSIAVLVAAALIACAGKDRWQQGRPPVYQSGGVVLYEGQPLAGAVVTFLPTTGTRTAFGRTDEAGKFTLTTFDADDGAIVDTFKVTVTKVVVENEPNPKDPEHLPPLHHAEYSEIPESYGDSKKTSLTVSIPEGGKKDIEISLTGKPTGKGTVGTPHNRPN